VTLAEPIATLFCGRFRHRPDPRLSLRVGVTAGACESFKEPKLASPLEKQIQNNFNRDGQVKARVKPIPVSGFTA
jgi:hypothetical protein